MQMPDIIDKALNMAIVATSAESEGKTSVREGRGRNARVFPVGGRHWGTPGNGYGRLRGRFQWSNIVGVWSQRRAGTTQVSTGVDGTYSRRTDSRTPLQSEDQVWTTGGGAASRPKNDEDCCAPRPRWIQCYNCGLLGLTRCSCPRGQRRNLNGIGRTKQTRRSA